MRRGGGRCVVPSDPPMSTPVRAKRSEGLVCVCVCESDDGVGGGERCRGGGIKSSAVRELTARGDVQDSRFRGSCPD